MWPKPRDPSITVDLTVDAEPLVAVVEAVREAGHRITPTAIVSRVIGDVLDEFPQLNVDLRGWKLRRRDAVDVWVTMTDEEGRLIGQRVDELHERDLLDVQEEITSTGEAHREGSHTPSKAVHKLVETTPLVVLRALVRVLEFLIHTLRLPLGAFGVDREGTGAVHVTNVGPFGFRHVAAPIPPITANAYLVTVGEIYEAPVVREGEVEARRVLPITGTIDHRAVVGLNAGHWAGYFEEKMTDPEALVGYLPDEVAEEIDVGALPDGGEAKANVARQFPG
jgi:pyruvate/2-oxoglutarate dehydrogenase complex dihydrolipoamide acyltransferase (E2) component